MSLWSSAVIILWVTQIQNLLMFFVNTSHEQMTHGSSPILHRLVMRLKFHRFHATSCPHYRLMSKFFFFYGNARRGVETEAGFLLQTAIQILLTLQWASEPYGGWTAERIAVTLPAGWRFRRRSSAAPRLRRESFPRWTRRWCGGSGLLSEWQRHTYHFHSCWSTFLLNFTGPLTHFFWQFRYITIYVIIL